MNKNDWIPVSERLPNHGEKVLIAFGPDRIIAMARYYETGPRQWLDACRGNEQYNPSFWQPLPDPPPPPKPDAFQVWWNEYVLQCLGTTGLAKEPQKHWAKKGWDAAIESAKK